MSQSSSALHRFFGGSPLTVFLKLVLLSLVIGVLMWVLGIDAFSLVRGIENLVRGLFENAAEALGMVLRWFMLGAVIVFPVWLILRLVRMGRT